MPAQRLVAMWEVRAGVIPGTTEPQYSKQWTYTSEEKQIDIANAHDGKEENIFTSKLKAVHKYAMELTNPAVLNWVETRFMWM